MTKAFLLFKHPLNSAKILQLYKELRISCYKNHSLILVRKMKHRNKEVKLSRAVNRVLTDRIKNPQQITGNERHAIWLYSKEREQYEWLNHYPTEKLARDAIFRHNPLYRTKVSRKACKALEKRGLINSNHTVLIKPYESD